MRIPSWMLAAGLALTALLSACGGSGSDNNSGNANVRLLNASIGYSSLDLKNGTTTVNSGIAFGSVGAFAGVGTDTTSAQILSAGTTTLLNTPSLAGMQKDANYTVIAWGDTGAVSNIVLAEVEAAPTTASKAKLLVMNLAAGAGTVDVYMTKDVDDLTNVSADVQVLTVGRTDSYREVDSGAYRLRVTASGLKSDLRLDVPAVTLETGKVHVLMLTSAPGSAMVNALLLPYQGAVTRYDNGIAKARVISALPTTSTVTAAINGNTLLNSVGSPAISGYANVTVTGGATLAWSIDSTAQANQALNLARSNTYSVLLWGSSASPTVSTLLDDTALPTAGTAKLRVINGVQGLGPVSLFVNLEPKLSGVDGGQIGGITVSSGTSEQQISVRAGATTIFTTSRQLNSTGIYTVLLSGEVGNINAQWVQQL